jgi:hypothetical protein
MIIEIVKDTVIDAGLQISSNFMLDHFSNGAIHHATGEILPRFSAQLIPNSYNNLMTTNGLPIWKIARVIQIGANSVVERMLGEFGSDLIVKSGFLNNISQATLAKGIDEVGHLVGKSFDFAVKGFEDNMYPLAKDIQKLANKASGLQMVFGDTSWIHIDIDPRKAASSAIREVLPDFSSVDLAAGVVEKGISSLRGVL